VASSRLITRRDGLRSADHSWMDMVHQVDNEKMSMSVASYHNQRAP